MRGQTCKAGTERRSRLHPRRLRAACQQHHSTDGARAVRRQLPEWVQARHQQAGSDRARREAGARRCPARRRQAQAQPASLLKACPRCLAGACRASCRSRGLHKASCRSRALRWASCQAPRRAPCRSLARRFRRQRGRSSPRQGRRQAVRACGAAPGGLRRGRGRGSTNCNVRGPKGQGRRRGRACRAGHAARGGRGAHLSMCKDCSEHSAARVHPPRSAPAPVPRPWRCGVRSTWRDWGLRRGRRGRRRRPAHGRRAQRRRPGAAPRPGAVQEQRCLCLGDQRGLTLRLGVELDPARARAARRVSV